MIWPLFLIVLRRLRWFNRRGLFVTLHGETRLYWRGDWCDAGYQVLFGQAGRVDLDSPFRRQARPTLPERPVEPMRGAGLRRAGEGR